MSGKGANGVSVIKIFMFVFTSNNYVIVVLIPVP